MDRGLPAVRGRYSLVAPVLVQWKLGYIKKKKWLNQVMRFRRSKKLAKKLWKNQSNSCNNEVLNLGCLQLPVFGLVKDVLRLYVLTYYWLSWEVDKQLRRLSSFERAHRAFLPSWRTRVQLLHTTLHWLECQGRGLKYRTRATITRSWLETALEY